MNSRRSRLRLTISAAIIAETLPNESCSNSSLSRDSILDEDRQTSELMEINIFYHEVNNIIKTNKDQNNDAIDN